MFTPPLAVDVGFAVRLGLLAALMSTLSACTPIVWDPVEAPREVSLNKLTPGAAFLFRRPRSGDSVGSSGSDGDWGEFQVGLLRGGLDLKDAELLEQLLRDNSSASYEAIRARTGADYLIEVLSSDMGMKPRPNNSDQSLACEVGSVTVKVVDIRTGSHVGLVEHGLTACPDTCTITRPDGEATGSCGWTKKHSEPYELVFKLPEGNRWRMLGGEVAKILLSHQ